MARRLLIVVSLALVLSTSALSQSLDVSKYAAKSPHTAGPHETWALIGGTPIDLDSTAVAVIFDDAGIECTGVLVGYKEVLTAAHCVAHLGAGTTVLVGGGFYEVATRWYSSAWRNLPVPDPSNARFDLGLFELTQPVTSVLPVPVLTDYPPFVGEWLAVYGTGTNEHNQLLAEVISIFVSHVQDGLFYTNYLVSRTGVCPGDSGSPVIAYIDAYPAVVGTSSYGDNTSPYDRYCSLNFPGGAYFVNLQSVYSQSFLSYFPGVLRLSANLVYIKRAMQIIQQGLAYSMVVDKPTKVRKKITKLKKVFLGIAPYADAKRLPYLADALQATIQIKNLRKTDQIMFQANRVLADVNAILSFDVN